MSGSGPIYEYQRELTAKLEQVMRERDEARVEVERFRSAVREKERLEFEALQELDEARAEVKRLRKAKHTNGCRQQSAYNVECVCGANETLRDLLRDVAERQREACELYLRTKAEEIMDDGGDRELAIALHRAADRVEDTPLVTEE